MSYNTPLSNIDFKQIDRKYEEAEKEQKDKASGRSLYQYTIYNIRSRAKNHNEMNFETNHQKPPKLQTENKRQEDG